MSKLTFGVEMELFIKQTVSLHKLIIKEIELNGFTTFQELLTFIISKTTYNPDKFIIDNNTPFINNIDNKTYNICILKPDDYYVIILIITYIICKNNKDTISFSLLKYVDCVDDNNIIYFKDYKNKLNWYYDLDFSLFILKNENVKTYRTIYDNFPQILTRNDLIFFTEFVSGIYDNTLEVKEGVSTLISSLTDLKLTPLHCENTSNHIHFSIKNETDADKGIKDSDLVFCITYVFYVLQNFIYLLCLPERRKSIFCSPLELEPNYWTKNFDEFTLDEFFNVLVTMEIPKGDEECYLDHSEIARLSILLSGVNNVKLTSKKLLLKIKTLDTKIKKLTTLPSDIKNKPFNSLVFEHQLIVLMHFYHTNTTYKMDNVLNKYTINIESSNKIGRYKILNLKKLSERQSCTLELRVKHGSNDSTEISNFCILIEKLVNVAEQMVLNKHIPLLKSLCTILNLDEKELSDFKKIHPIDLQEQYKNQKRLLTKILKGLYKTDNDSMTYWKKQLKRINEPMNQHLGKSLSFTKSSSNSRKRTL